MNLLTIIQKTASCQSIQNIRDVLASVSPIILHITPKIGILNIFLIQNKGKGPPGRSRSPDAPNILYPEIKPATGKSSKKTDHIIQSQYFKFFHN